MAALDAGAAVEAVFVDGGQDLEDSLARALARADDGGLPIYRLTTEAFRRAANAQSPQGLMATVAFVAPTLESVGVPGTAVALHDVRDPGNAGAVVRVAEASGAVAVLLTGEAVDPYNPKALRATAGSIFRVPVVVTSLASATAWVANYGGRAWAAVARGGVDAFSAELGGPTLLVLGNEGEGLGEDALAACPDRVTIPMDGGTESLNVAVAAGVLLYAARAARPAPASPSIEAQ